MFDFYVNENISKAETLPASFYRDDEVFEALKKTGFQKYLAVERMLTGALSRGRLCTTHVFFR
jgi:hypothetical protein